MVSVVQFRPWAPSTHSGIRFSRQSYDFNAGETRANGVGYSSKARWEEAQVLMKVYGSLIKAEPDVSVHLTNDFKSKRWP